MKEYVKAGFIWLFLVSIASCPVFAALAVLAHLVQREEDAESYKSLSVISGVIGSIGFGIIFFTVSEGD